MSEGMTFENHRVKTVLKEKPPPRVLVILLTHNSNLDWLRDAAWSVLAQTYPQITLYVADSTKDDVKRHATQSLIQGLKGPEFGHRDRNVEFVSTEPLPTADVASKVNLAANTYNGHEYVMVMSDDDWLAPHAIAQQVSALEANPTHAFAQGHVVMFGLQYGVWNIPSDKIINHQISQNQFAGTCVMRMAPFLKLGGYQKDVVPEGHPTGLEDFNLFVGYLKYGWKYSVINEPHLFARTHDKQNNRAIYGTQKYWDILLKVICPRYGVTIEILDEETKMSKVTTEVLTLEPKSLHSAG